MVTSDNLLMLLIPTAAEVVESLDKKIISLRAFKELKGLVAGAYPSYEKVTALRNALRGNATNKLDNIAKNLQKRRQQTGQMALGLFKSRSRLMGRH